MAKKKQQKQNNNMDMVVKTFVLTAALALPLGYAVGNMTADSDDVKDTQSVHESDDDMAMEMTMKTPEPFEVPEGEEIPRLVNLTVTKDNKAGWNISFDTENFTFTPENASTPHVASQGHAHLHIDGEKVSRLYSDNFYVGDLEPGEHTFSVYLNTNDHREYVANGVGTGEEAVITQQ